MPIPPLYASLLASSDGMAPSLDRASHVLEIWLHLPCERRLVVPPGWFMGTVLTTEFLIKGWDMRGLISAVLCPSCHTAMLGGEGSELGLISGQYGKGTLFVPYSHALGLYHIGSTPPCLPAGCVCLVLILLQRCPYLPPFHSPPVYSAFLATFPDMGLSCGWAARAHHQP